MFIAIPIMSVPLLKQKIAHALDNTGVPMGESEVMAEAELELSDGSDGGDGGRRPRGRHFVSAGVAIVVVLVGVGVLAEEVDEATVVSAQRVDQSTVSTLPGATTTVVTFLPIGEEPVSTTSTTSVPGLFPGGGSEPGSDPGPVPIAGPTPAAPPTSPPTAPPPPPETGSASISVTQDRGPYVTVTWSSSGGTRVSVAGDGVSSTDSSGARSLCLGRGCSGGTGSWSIVVYGSAGQVLASDSTSITAF
jgi:hypothetical protein